MSWLRPCSKNCGWTGSRWVTQPGLLGCLCRCCDPGGPQRRSQMTNSNGCNGLEHAARRIREITGSDSGAALIAPRFAGSNRNGIDVIDAGCDDLLISWAAGSVTTTEMLDRVFDDWRHDPVFEVFTASDGLPGLRARNPGKPETQTTAAQRVIAAVEQASDNTTTVAAPRLVDVANHTGDNDDSEAMTPQELMAVSGALRARSGTLRGRCEALDTAARSLSDAAANGAAPSPQPRLRASTAPQAVGAAAAKRDSSSGGSRLSQPAPAQRGVGLFAHLGFFVACQRLQQRLRARRVDGHHFAHEAVAVSGETPQHLRRTARVAGHISPHPRVAVNGEPHQRVLWTDRVAGNTGTHLLLWICGQSCEQAGVAAGVRGRR